MFKLLKISYLNNKRPITINSLIILCLELVHVISLYYLNDIYGELYKGIHDSNSKLIWDSIASFTGIAMFLVLITGYIGYFANKVAFNIREGLTFHYFTRPYEYKDQPFVNQRVQEDIRKYGESFTEIVLSIFKAVLKLPIFLFVIVNLTEWYIGLLIFLAVFLGTYISRAMSKRLVPLQSEQESNEAMFRASLSVINFHIIKEQFKKVNQEFKKLSFVQSGLGQMFVLLPFIVLMPLYIAKKIEMGAFFQAVNALGKIIDSLMVLIDSRQVIITVEMTSKRLEFLTEENNV